MLQGLLRYHNWSGKRILQLLKKREETASPEANVFLTSEALKLSRMMQAHLAHSMSSSVTTMWPWNLMQLICFATENVQEALTILNEIVQGMIGMCIHSFLSTKPIFTVDFT